MITKTILRGNELFCHYAKKVPYLLATVIILSLTGLESFAQQPKSVDLMTLSGSGQQPYLYREMPNGKRLVACQIANSISIYDYNSANDTTTQQFLSTNLYRLFVAEVNQSNHVEWVKYFNVGMFQDVAFDEANNIYLTGNYQDVLISSSGDTLAQITNDGNSVGDVFIISLNQNGRTRWMHSSDNGSITQAPPYSYYIKCDNHGHVYFTGFYDRYINFDNQFTFMRNESAPQFGFIPFLAGMDTSGNYLFVHDWNLSTAYSCGLTLDSCRIYVPTDDGSNATQTTLRVFDYTGRLLNIITYPFGGFNYAYENVQVKDNRMIIVELLYNPTGAGGRVIDYMDINGNKIWQDTLSYVTITNLNFTKNGKIFFAADVGGNDSVQIGTFAVKPGVVFGIIDTTGRIKIVKNIVDQDITTNSLSLSGSGNVYITVDMFVNQISNNSYVFDSDTLKNLNYKDSSGFPTGYGFRVLAAYKISDSLYASTTNCNNVFPVSGCTDREGLPANIVKPDIIWNGSSFSTSTTYNSYQWLLNDNIINGANLPTYIPVTIGNYSLEATNAFGCKGKSDIYTLVVTGITSVSSDHKAIILPNPATDKVVVQFKQIPNTPLSIQLISADGKLLRTINTQNQQIYLSLSDVSSGLYFLKIIGKGYDQVQKLIVEKR